MKDSIKLYKYIIEMGRPGYGEKTLSDLTQKDCNFLVYIGMYSGEKPMDQ